MTHSAKPYKPPINALIFKTAASYAAVWFEAALSSGLPRGKYVGSGDKPLKMFVQDHMEKFIPLVISNFIDMLGPNSNCTEHMKEEIHKAITDPDNDTELMRMGRTNTKAQHERMIKDAITKFDQNKVKFPINAPEMSKLPTKLDLKSSTIIGG